MAFEPYSLVFDLLDAVPDVMACAKRADGTYVAANEAFARRAHRRIADVVGRRADDIFPAELVASYDAQDRALLLTGQSVRNHLEVIAAPGRDEHRWYLTTKVLTANNEGDPVIVAVSTDARLGERDGAVAAGLRAAVELAHERCTETLRVADLATAAGMSTDRLERAMRRVLGVSPKRYLLRLRSDLAATLLSKTDRPIVSIAVQCGYYDQSQMTRQFRDHHGLTPAAYRAATTSALQPPDH